MVFDSNRGVAVLQLNAAGADIWEFLSVPPHNASYRSSFIKPAC
jgi:hypothetical protein